MCVHLDLDFVSLLHASHMCSVQMLGCVDEPLHIASLGSSYIFLSIHMHVLRCGMQNRIAIDWLIVPDWTTLSVSKLLDMLLAAGLI